jgi:hypothetical protein
MTLRSGVENSISFLEKSCSTDTFWSLLHVYDRSPLEDYVIECGYENDIICHPRP